MLVGRLLPYFCLPDRALTRMRSIYRGEYSRLLWPVPRPYARRRRGNLIWFR